MPELLVHAQSQLVPANFAEKAMASLMQLHAELMDEKERRVELFRRLMEREQSLAELRFYVTALEERLETPARDSKPSTPPAAMVPEMPPQRPPISVESPAKARAVAGWRTW
jgi:hypothetical protein